MVRNGLSGLNGASLMIKFFVLVNGISSGFFQSSKGLRQGNPLSPYLFVLAMEVFGCLLEKAREGFFFPCFRGKRSGRGSERVEVSRLLFVDDTLIFCKASQRQVAHLNWLLM